MTSEPAPCSSATPGNGGGCSTCGGLGFLVFDVPPGDARFNQAQPCACTAAQRYAELFAGKFANMALENFKVLTPDERAALKAAQGAAKAWMQGQRRSLIFYAALQDSRRAFPATASCT